MSHSPNPQDTHLESLLAEIADEFAQACQRGEAPDTEEYARRYPDLADVVRRLFPALQAIQGRSRTQMGSMDPEAIAGARDRRNRDELPTDLAEVGYEILDEVGRGGMGVVYRARQVGLDRIVALKMVRPGGKDGGELKRFQREALVLARTSHPNIVQIHQVGEHQGRLFFSLEYVAGGNLAAHLAGTPQPPRQAAETVRILAEAMQVAHNQGVIHRDLKPANILREADGTLKITDFGLARTIDDTHQTQTGAIVGTPSYMSPEQASGETKELGPETDVYALGVILYEMLTGHPPFKGATAMETIDKVLRQEPISPRRVQPSCPRDLETICLKCLEKQPAHRYASASALAGDLQAFLDGRPIHARPVSVWQRSLKWARRRPAQAIAVALSGIVLLSLVGLVLGLTYARIQRQGRARAEQAARREREAKQVAVQAQREVEQERTRTEILRYARTVQGAHDEWQQNNVPRARQLLNECPESHRQWEWHYVNRLCHQEILSVPWHINGQAFTLGNIFKNTVQFTPDGEHVLAVTAMPRREEIKAWNTGTGQETLTFQPPEVRTGLIKNFCLSPNGKCLAILIRNRVDVWNYPPTKKLFTRSLEVSLTGMAGLCFSPIGDFLATVSGQRANEISLVNASTGKLHQLLKGLPAPVAQLRFNPGGDMLAAADTSGRIKVWSTLTGRELVSLLGHEEKVSALEFLDQSRQLVSAAWTDRLQGEFSEIHVWSLARGELSRRHPYHGHQAMVQVLEASPSGDLLAIGYSDGMIVVKETGRPRSYHLRGHTAAIHDLAFTADGSKLASISLDGTVKVWFPTYPLERIPYPEEEIKYPSCYINHDGSRIVFNNRNREIRIEDEDRQELLTFSMPQGRRITVGPPAFSRDNQFIAFPLTEHLDQAKTGTNIALVDLQVGKVVQQWQGHQRIIREMRISPRGDVLATCCLPGPVPYKKKASVKLWELSTTRLLYTFTTPVALLRGICFSPDGTKLAAWGGRPDELGLPGATCIWEVSTGKTLHVFRASPKVSHSFACFSPDSRLLAVGEELSRRDGASCKVLIHDVQTGERIQELHGHRDSIQGMAFSPDGKRLVCTDWGKGMLKFWDWKNGVSVLTLRYPREDSFQVVGFSSDGTRLTVDTKSLDTRIGGIPYQILDSRLVDWSEVNTSGK